MISIEINDELDYCVLKQGRIACEVHASDYFNDCTEQDYTKLLNAQTFLQDLQSGVKFSNQYNFHLNLAGCELAEGEILLNKSDESFDMLGVINMSFRPHEIVFKLSRDHEDTTYIQFVTYEKNDHMVFLTFIKFMIKYLEKYLKKRTDKRE